MSDYYRPKSLGQTKIADNSHVIEGRRAGLTEDNPDLQVALSLQTIRNGMSLEALANAFDVSKECARRAAIFVANLEKAQKYIHEVYEKGAEGANRIAWKIYYEHSREIELLMTILSKDSDVDKVEETISAFRIYGGWLVDCIATTSRIFEEPQVLVDLNESCQQLYEEI